MKKQWALLTRSPSEKALDARIAEGHANAGTTDDVNRPTTGSAAQSHLGDARRRIRKREDRKRSHETRLPDAPLHPIGVSTAPQGLPLRSGSILGPLDREIYEEPEIPPRNPARAVTAPVSEPAAVSVDEVSRANDTPGSISAPDDSATNPGHDALGLMDRLSPPKRRLDLEREDSRRNSQIKPGIATVDGADGQHGRSANT